MLCLTSVWSLPRYPNKLDAVCCVSVHYVCKNDYVKTTKESANWLLVAKNCYIIGPHALKCVLYEQHSESAFMLPKRPFIQLRVTTYFLGTSERKKLFSHVVQKDMGILNVSEAYLAVYDWLIISFRKVAIWGAFWFDAKVYRYASSCLSLTHYIYFSIYLYPCTV